MQGIQNICVRMGFKKYSKEMELRGRRDRRIRKKIASQLRNMGYNVSKVRQIVKEKEGWTANVRIAEKYYEILISSDYQIKSILERGYCKLICHELGFVMK